ncbi:hypothetical protein I350_05720 [Cryptococcus amylolentus CBS 6273]|uniref:Uncharacterized protein n=1 Tax=Cryptococcus amylolentus CBS 6273 TaxID=1296118 RepID=A0A1E3JPQ7_9TREE|nr:hypothetical protein I350_05720 [Cryptococcus amylolentus CBS 6273]
MSDPPSESSSHYYASDAGDGSSYVEDWESDRLAINRTMLEAGLLQEDEEDFTGTDLNFEDMDFDDFKDDDEEVTETGESLEEKARCLLMSEGYRQAAREFTQRKQKLIDEIDRLTEAGSSTNTGRLRMKDLKRQKQKLDEGNNIFAGNKCYRVRGGYI